MKAKLVVVGGDVKAAEINLKLPTIIGRGREATLTLPHPLVSRKHCEIFEVDGVLKVRDLGSLNGTYVGQQRVDEAVLPHGELLTIATVNFRAEYEGMELVDTPHEDVDHEEAHHEVANNDSTHGPDRLTINQVDERPAVLSEMPQPPASAPGPGSSVERDTEWQVGSTPPRSSTADSNDLSSLLNKEDRSR